MDADHIAAIDNVVRKLMQGGKRPVGVGLFFALGHSTVVVVAVAVVGTATALLASATAFKEVGGLVGTLVSAFFLFAIAATNFVILHEIWRAFRRVRRGQGYPHEDLDVLLDSRGVLARMLRPVFRLVTKSWHMFPLGFLFGIGFEAATEVALLGISANEAAKGTFLWSIMVFPALFAAGMSLMDTIDGVLMLGAYDWAFRALIRQLYYNLTITFVSVAVAVLVGSVEVLGLVGDQFALDGALRRLVRALNDNFNALGFVIIGLFVAAWAVSTGVYRLKRLDELPLGAAGGQCRAPVATVRDRTSSGRARA